MGIICALVCLTAIALFPAKAWNVNSRNLDCVVGEWREWGPCLHDFTDPTFFEIKLRSRRRPILQQPYGNGKKCPQLQKTEECNEPISPVDCQVSTWSGWSRCFTQNWEKTSDTRERQRAIVVPPSEGGEKCPELKETEKCDSPPKAVDCVVSTWNPWTECFADFNDNLEAISVRERVRFIDIEPSGNGNDCPGLIQTEICSGNEDPFYTKPIQNSNSVSDDVSGKTTSSGKDDDIHLSKTPKKVEEKEEQSKNLSFWKFFQSFYRRFSRAWPRA